MTKPTYMIGSNPHGQTPRLQTIFSLRAAIQIYFNIKLMVDESNKASLCINLFYCDLGSSIAISLNKILVCTINN